MNSQSLSENTALERINKKCLDADFSFLGFNNEENKYINTKTKLKLKCNKCGYEWETTTFDKLMSRPNTCLNCNKKRKLTPIEKEKRILERCKELDYTFLGFADNGKLKLKCNKCGVEWDTTTFNNLIRHNRKSHSCGRKNPLSMPKNYKDKNNIKNKILEKLKGSNLEFVDFVEKENIEVVKYHILLKCRLCGETKMYYLHYLLNSKKTIKCKFCENFNKRQNDEATRIINEKCQLLDYTFLGFKNEYNRYINKKTKLILKCNKCGYVWDTTTFDNFINTCIKCRNCTNCWKMEKEVKYFLDKHNIEYNEQKRFDWLKNKIALSLDFFLPKYNIAIECQGKQHFQPVDAFGGEKDFLLTRERDKVKKELCEKNNVRLIYFNNENDVKTFLNEKVIRNIRELKKVIYE